MSYETKAGVVVSCSFLCLVGVVLSSKLWEGQTANAGTSSTETEKKEAAGAGPQSSDPAALAGPGIPKLKTPPDGIQLVNGPSAPAPRNRVGELFDEGEDQFQTKPYMADDPPTAPPAAPNIPAFGANQGDAKPAATNPPDPTPTPSMPVTNTAATPLVPKEGAAPSFEQILKNQAAAGAGGAAQTSQPATGATTITPVVPDMSKPASPSLADMYAEAEKKRQAAEAAAAAAGAGAQQSTTDASNDIARNLAKQKELAQGSGAANPVKDILADTGSGGQRQPTTAPATGAGGGGDMGNVGAGAGVSGVPIPVVPNNADASQLRQPTNGYSPPPNTDAVGPGRRSPVTLDTPAAPPDNQMAQLRNGQPAPYDPPPIGARPETSIQPISVSAPTPPAPAQKDHWDDDFYEARAGDTFQGIARDYYHSDTYAQALMLYNRDHLLATTATKEHPETILAGQRVYEPPVRILKRDYGSVISDQADSAGARVASGQPARAAATTSPAVQPLPEKRYRVRGSGEMFLTIARTRLGDENRWPEIYQLNPAFDPPTNLIPGGSILRMPGDAKIDPMDVPSGQ